MMPVARVYVDAAAGDRYIDLTGTLLVWAAWRCTSAVDGKVPFADLVDIADRTVYDDAGDLFRIVQIRSNLR